MRAKLADIRFRIKCLLWTATVLAACQPGCLLGSSSCEDSPSHRVEARLTLPVDDAGQTVASAPATPEECATFCQQHGLVGNQFTCTAEAADGGRTVVVCSFNTVCKGPRPIGLIGPTRSDPSRSIPGSELAALGR